MVMKRNVKKFAAFTLAISLSGTIGVDKTVNAGDDRVDAKDSSSVATQYNLSYLDYLDGLRLVDTAVTRFVNTALTRFVNTALMRRVETAYILRFLEKLGLGVSQVNTGSGAQRLKQEQLNQAQLKQEQLEQAWEQLKQALERQYQAWRTWDGSEQELARREQMPLQAQLEIERERMLRLMSPTPQEIDPERLQKWLQLQAQLKRVLEWRQAQEPQERARDLEQELDLELKVERRQEQEWKQQWEQQWDLLKWLSEQSAQLQAQYREAQEWLEWLQKQPAPLRAQLQPQQERVLKWLQKLQEQMEQEQAQERQVRMKMKLQEQMEQEQAQERQASADVSQALERVEQRFPLMVFQSL